MLDVGKVRWDLVFTHSFVAHVRLEIHDGIVDRHGLWHQIDDFSWSSEFCERVHFDEPQKVARILASDQALESSPFA